MPATGARVAIALALVLVAGALIGIATIGSGSDESGSQYAFGADPDALLPDLVTAPPRDLRIEETPDSRRLRFTHEIQNVGTGPFEVHPVSADCGNDEVREDYGAEQWIYLDSDGNGTFDPEADTKHRSERIGCLSYHALHEHWHIDEFVSYELFAIEGGDELAREPAATSPKVSFCTVDNLRPNPELPGAPPGPVYQALDELPGDCEEGTTIGISVGYGDVYEASLVDQWLEISGLEDGTYCLVTATDVSDIVPEVEEGNNEQRRPLDLRGERAHFSATERAC